MDAGKGENSKIQPAPFTAGEIMSNKCPYSVGDKVRFTPSERTRGLYQDVERFGIKINQVAIIREIRDGAYLYFDDDTGGFPWDEFSPVQEEE